MKYITGQILVDKHSGAERKVLGVCDLVVFTSWAENFERCYGTQTEQELDPLYTIKEEKFVPTELSEYWFATDYGSTVCCTWAGSISDKFRLSQGNVFRTRELAEAKLKELMK